MKGPLYAAIFSSCLFFGSFLPFLGFTPTQGRDGHDRVSAREDAVGACSIEMAAERFMATATYYEAEKIGAVNNRTDRLMATTPLSPWLSSSFVEDLICQRE